jgi:AcrR family transcriptional regulator
MRWSAHRRARRAELVEAAVRAVTRCGPHVGMDEIAAEAGVTKPVLYRQFTDKSDLHVAVGQRAAATLISEIERQLAVLDDPRERTAAVVDAFLRAIEAAPQVYRFVVARPLAEGRSVATEPAPDYLTVLSTRFAAMIGEALHARGADTRGVQAWARGLVGLVQSTGEWWLEQRTMSRGALVDHLTRLIWTGLAGLLGEAEPAGATPSLPAARQRD